ncbi:hypothetical protein CK203_088378 [Vitis vinifera]|uniref:Uncharacterized protein n=1 Tax=Vitis vinifera TaxID=29760 RepID=A0A438E0W5_VITVI|nr:hypothetical protein CK203_088378 [Vitis vinifera]
MVQQPFFGRFIDSRGVGTGLRGGSMEFLLFKTFYDWELEDKMVWMDSKRKPLKLAWVLAKRNKKMLGWPLPCACSGLYGKKKIGSHLKIGSNLKMLNKWTKHCKEDIKDFRPINLIGGFYKFLVKILANRLKKVIGKRVMVGDSIKGIKVEAYGVAGEGKNQGFFMSREGQESVEAWILGALGISKRHYWQVPLEICYQAQQLLEKGDLEDWFVWKDDRKESFSITSYYLSLASIETSTFLAKLIFRPSHEMRVEFG